MQLHSDYNIMLSYPGLLKDPRNGSLPKMTHRYVGETEGLFGGCFIVAAAIHLEGKMPWASLVELFGTPGVCGDSV